MLPTLARRGPDGEGVNTWPGAALGHRRLAIIDLSEAGHQPMLSDDGKIGLVFNGCIYNFVEIRKELEERGHRFRSNCDTEVILRGYQEWGVDRLVPRLHGMFAFAIWDHPRRKLSLVRDRLGVKPLLYRMRGSEIAFASTLPAIEASGSSRGEIDPEAVLEFLEFGFVTDERSIDPEIRKLPPASILEWENGKTRESVYWTLPEANQQTAKISFNEAVEETERLIIESVRLRLISDVPIGALLSGGVDSALICWALTKLNTNVRAFTVGAPGDPDDETADAREVAQILGIPHEIVNISSDQPVPLDEVIAAYGEPFGSQSALGMLRVSKAVKPFATVLLTGDGGDDVYLGYSFFQNAWRAEKLARRLPSISPAAWKALRPLCWSSRMRNFLDYTTGGIGAYARVRRGLPYLEGHGILGPKLSGLSLAHRDVANSFDSSRNLLNEVFQFHRRMHFLSEFMTKVDGGTMHYGIEARSPLLDHKLWEFAAVLPAEIRFQGGHLKAVLREIVRKNIGPNVAFRRKRGFTIPVDRWLATRWAPVLQALEQNSQLERGGWIHRKGLSAAIAEAKRNQTAPFQLWNVLVLEHWLQKHSAAQSLNEPSLQSV
jgi:asparagine synthase (glutamine-hydrolysing)